MGRAICADASEFERPAVVEMTCLRTLDDHHAYERSADYATNGELATARRWVVRVVLFDEGVRLPERRRS